MKTYKAIVKDKKDGERMIIEREYETKASFIADLRANGFAVNSNKVKESKVFDWIMDNTNCNPWDWRKKRYYGVELSR